MKLELPARPSLDHLRKQAKDLLAAARAGDAEAAARVAAVTASKSPRLHDAQLALAREYGFPSWRDLATKVRTSQTDGFLEAASGDKWDRANPVTMPPEPIRLSNVFVAAAAGDVEALKKHIARDPEAARTKGGPMDRSPLQYLAFSRLNSKAPSRFAEAARLLLENGADPNEAWLHPAYPDNPLPTLFGACGVVYNAELAQVLIEHGANVDDNESLYHSTESRDHSCLKLLLANNAKIDGTNALFRMLDHDDAEGLKLMLDAGASMNDPSSKESPLNHAIRSGRGRAHLELLLEYGADPKRLSIEGYSPYSLALRSANVEAAEFLAQIGYAEHDPKIEFLRAAISGDEAAARATGVTAADLQPADLDSLVESAWNLKPEAVRTMLALGFPAGHRATHDGHTALHAAAWKGQAALVADILAYDPPLDVKDNRFDALPTGWAIHGSMYAYDGDGKYLNPNADYAQTTRLLLEAGAPLHPEHASGSPDVNKVIEEFKNR